MKNYEKSILDPYKLAEQIKRDFELPEEKARAIFTWIALNIEYDVKGLSSNQKSISYSYKSPEEKIQKEQEIKINIVNQTLTSKKAVCFGYSTLFDFLCDIVSIDSEIVIGFAKTKKTDIGKLPNKIDHAWNIIKINNEWKLVDITWGAGYLYENSIEFVPSFNPFYFFSPPEKFFLNHYPENDISLFIKMSENKFANLPLYYSHAFIKNIEIIEPQKGILSIPKNKKIKFVLRNDNFETISVKFDNEKYSKRITPLIENGLCIYEIECEKNTNTFLTLFAEDVSIVTFKLMKK